MQRIAIWGICTRFEPSQTFSACSKVWPSNPCPLSSPSCSWTTTWHPSKQNRCDRGHSEIAWLKTVPARDDSAWNPILGAVVGYRPTGVRSGLDRSECPFARRSIYGFRHFRGSSIGLDGLQTNQMPGLPLILVTPNDPKLHPMRSPFKSLIPSQRRCRIIGYKKH